jgi:hypothetical protein
VSSSYDNERQQAFLGRGLLTSLFVHLGILFPLCTIAFLLGAREDARKAEEVEMTFEEVNPADLPADLPPIDPEDLPREPPRPKLAVRPDQEEAMPEKRMALHWRPDLYLLSRSDSRNTNYSDPVIRNEKAGNLLFPAMVVS